MSSSIQHFFVSQALHLREGRFDLLSRPYSIPLVVMMPGDARMVSILPSRHAVENFFRAKFEGLEAAGIDYLRAMVSEVEILSPRRYAASVTWYYLDPAGKRQGETLARYFLGRRSGGLSVEMIEFERLAFSAIGEWVERNDVRVPPARYTR